MRGSRRDPEWLGWRLTREGEVAVPLYEVNIPRFSEYVRCD